MLDALGNLHKREVAQRKGIKEIMALLENNNPFNTLNNTVQADFSKIKLLTTSGT